MRCVTCQVCHNLTCPDEIPLPGTHAASLGRLHPARAELSPRCTSRHNVHTVRLNLPDCGLCTRTLHWGAFWLHRQPESRDARLCQSCRGWLVDGVVRERRGAPDTLAQLMRDLRRPATLRLRRRHRSWKEPAWLPSTSATRRSAARGAAKPAPIPAGGSCRAIPLPLR